MEAKTDLFVGVEAYTVDSCKHQMTITLNVHSKDFGIDKYKTVYDEIRSSLQEKGLMPYLQTKRS